MRSRRTRMAGGGGNARATLLPSSEVGMTSSGASDQMPHGMRPCIAAGSGVVAAKARRLLRIAAAPNVVSRQADLTNPPIRDGYAKRERSRRVPPPTWRVLVLHESVFLSGGEIPSVTGLATIAGNKAAPAPVSSAFGPSWAQRRKTWRKTKSTGAARWNA